MATWPGRLTLPPARQRASHSTIPAHCRPPRPSMPGDTRSRQAFELIFRVLRSSADRRTAPAQKSVWFCATRRASDPQRIPAEKTARVSAFVLVALAACSDATPYPTSISSGCAFIRHRHRSDDPFTNLQSGFLMTENPGCKSGTSTTHRYPSVDCKDRANPLPPPEVAITSSVSSTFYSTRMSASSKKFARSA